MTSNYFFTNSRGRFNVNQIILLGTNVIAEEIYFKNFPRSRVSENYTWFKQINGGKLNYSIKGVDVVNNSNCGAQPTNNYPVGTHSVPVPAWATKVAFVLVGSGGGGGTGGRGSNANNGSGGAGGGSGAVLISNAMTLTNYNNIPVVVGNGGLGGVRALRNNLANSGVNIGIGTNGGTGGSSTITINGFNYISYGGRGGQNGFNVSADQNAGFGISGANSGNPVGFNADNNMQTAAFGNAAADGILAYDGSPGTAGASINVTPTSSYYSPIISTGGAGGPKGSDGGNPGLDGTGYGAGGGGGGGSTKDGGNLGGAGGDGTGGTARLVFYP